MTHFKNERSSWGAPWVAVGLGVAVAISQQTAVASPARMPPAAETGVPESTCMSPDAEEDVTSCLQVKNKMPEVPSPAQVKRELVDAARDPPAAAVKSNDDGPFFGCGLLGILPGVTNGIAPPETQRAGRPWRTRRLIDAIKTSSTYNKATYWNWDYSPHKGQSLTSDILFHPENWGAQVVKEEDLIEAGKANFTDAGGKVCPATMGEILLGMNEPDVQGFCQGNMFGSCTSTCTQAAIRAHDCPTASWSGPPAHANPQGECNCTTGATGMGFWPVTGCTNNQPLPNLWTDPQCIPVVMDNWRQSAKIAISKGYKYMSTPIIAGNMNWAKSFIEQACATCHDISCGCPQYVAFHFYSSDCQPISTGGYANFQAQLNVIKEIMEEYSFVKGGIVNEVGMLNCGGPSCKYPAAKQPGNTCPANPEMPHGWASYIDTLFDMVINTKTKDGRRVMKGFTWFNEDENGGTYDQLLWDKAGKVNEVGDAYMKACTRWGQAQRGDTEK